MRVNLSRAQADEVCRSEYANRLLSHIKRSESPHDLGWWTTRPKLATHAGHRRPGAIRAYLSLAQYTAVTSRQQTFPAVFDFNDGTRARVDKGIVKALLDHNLLGYNTENQELLFQLTAAGVPWLNDASRHGIHT